MLSRTIYKVIQKGVKVVLEIWMEPCLRQNNSNKPKNNNEIPSSYTKDD